MVTKKKTEKVQKTVKKADAAKAPATPEKRGAIDIVRKRFAEESGKDILKVLSGIRGAGKTTAIDAVIADLVKKGVPKANIIRLDFEDPSMRHMKTYKDVLDILKARKAEGRTYLFLEELDSLLDYEVLMGVLYGMKEYEVTVTTSNRKLFASEVMNYFKGRLLRLALPAPDWPRDRGELERVWGKMFLCDVLGGHALADATAEERLAEFLSDHMGELFSLRKISRTLDINGHKLHSNTVAEYLRALTDAFFIEAAPVYDTFEGAVVNIGARYFWTDLALRDGRFGPSPELEEERLKYTKKYLELRRTRGKVMCEKSETFFANFVVTDREGKKEIVKWKEF